MKYEIINTGSDGNATVIDGQILIDCGIPYKSLAKYAADLRLVLTTHQHSDHFNKSTVHRLAHDRPTLHWACGPWMAGWLLTAGVDRRNIDLLEPDTWYYYGPQLGVTVNYFETHHNVPNCGWKLWKGANDTLLYATDLGDLEGIEAKGYTLYLLEANHTQAEIEAAVAEAMEKGEFTYRTKAAENHLSYEQAVDWLTENMGPNSVWVPMHQHKEKETQEDGLVRSTSNNGETSEDAAACEPS